MKLTGIILAIILFALNGYSQHKSPAEKKYNIVNRQLTLTDGSEGVHLNAAPGAGIAWINEKQFSYGTIEFDVKGRNEFQASFVGIAFHGENDSTYESVYFRPFNFQAADLLRKGHSVQYIASPKYDWPVLRSQFPNKYEQPISPSPDPNQWFHVRMEVSDKFIEIYVNGNSSPSLKIAPLVGLRGKMIGYWVGNGSDGDWKNLKITSKQ